MTVMSEARKGLDALDNWYGGFPGPQKYSTLEQLRTDTPVPGVDISDIEGPKNPDWEAFIQSVVDLEQWQGLQFGGLYLYGTPGTGKTHAAIGLGRMLAESGAEVHYRYMKDGDSGDRVKWNDSRGSPVGARLGNNPKTDGGTVFPLHSYPGAEVPMSLKSVLILDDYSPENAPVLRTASEAAAQYGGMIIVTSNHIDPFSILEDRARSVDSANGSLDELHTIALKEMVRRDNPLALEEHERLQDEKLQAAETSAMEADDSFRSRIAAGFKMIPFFGEDRRPEQSIWR